MWRRTLGAVITPLVVAALIVLNSGGRVTGLDGRVSTVRVGYLSTLVNAPAIVGIGEGLFQAALGDVVIDTRVFNAGPALIEALFAGEVDLAYVGPNPAINAWVRSGGKAIRIVAASTVGGSGLVVRSDWEPVQASDFANRRMGSPQTGNTQDISLRNHLRLLGVPTDGSKGAAQITASGNPEVYTLFARGELDGAWVAEPWITRLLRTGHGRLWIDEAHLVTAYVVVRQDFLAAASDLVAAWLQVHVAVSERLNASPRDSAAIVAKQLSELWQQEVPVAEVEDGLQRIRFNWTVSEEAIGELARNAHDLGYLGTRPPDLVGIFDPEPLSRALELNHSR